jgi:hypothetical protein
LNVTRTQLAIPDQISVFHQKNYLCSLLRRRNNSRPLLTENFRSLQKFYDQIINNKNVLLFSGKSKEKAFIIVFFSQIAFIGKTNVV